MAENTSATGGVLTQVSGPIEGLELRRALQAIFAALSGLPGNMVRPAFQKDPAPWPDSGTDWMAFNVASRSTVGTAYQDPATDNGIVHAHAFRTKRDVKFVIQFYFYGPDGAAIHGRMRDAIEIGQNRDTLMALGFGFTRMTDAQYVGEQTPDEEYLDRWDAQMVLTREELRVFRILNLEGSYGIIHANRAVTTLDQEWTAKPHNEET